MIDIIIANKEYKIESWWNWIAIDDNGEIYAFYNKPEFIYWDAYGDGRDWDVESDYEWGYVGTISEQEIPYGRLYKIERGLG